MNWFKKAGKNKKCKGWLAVRLDAGIARKIQSWGKDSIPEEDLALDGRETDTHITVIYGMCNDNPSVVKAALKDVKPITATLGKVGYFASSPENDVVIIKIKSKDLKDVNHHLLDTFNIQTTFDEYKPHCTIAYVKKGKAHKYAGDTVFDGTKLTFNKIVYINNKKEETEFKLK